MSSRGARRSFEDASPLAQSSDDALVAAAARHAQGVDAHSRGDDARPALIEEGLSLLARAPRESGPTIWAATIASSSIATRAGAAHLLRGHLLMFRPVGPGRRRATRCATSRSSRAHRAITTPRARRSTARSRCSATTATPRHRGRAQRARQPRALARAFELGREWLEEALASAARWATAAPPRDAGLPRPARGRAGRRDEGAG